MIGLFINNQECDFSDINFELTFSNTLLTKQGIFCIDIDLNLLSPKNAKIYSHINIDRDNMTNNKDTVTLLIDNIPYSGFSTINNYDEDSYILNISLWIQSSTISQIVSDEDLKIIDLNLGQIEEVLSYPLKITDEFGEWFNPDFLNATYPTVNYAVAPQKAKDINGVWRTYNYYSTNRDEDDILNPRHWELLGSLAGNITHKQPYLFYVLDKIFKALGNTGVAVASGLEDYYQKTYLVHNFNSTYLEDIVPDITVSEFISRIESWLSCIFSADSDGYIRAYPIIAQSNQEVTFIEDNQVIKEDVVEIIDSAEEIAAIAANTSYKYKTPDVDYFKINNIDEELLELATIVEVATFDDIPVDVTTTKFGHPEVEALYNANTIWKVLDSKLMYTLQDIPSYYRLTRINVIGQYVAESTNLIELDLNPAAMDLIFVRYSYYNPAPVFDSELYNVHIPVSNQDRKERTPAITGIYPYFLTEYSRNVSELIELAFYQGIVIFATESYYSELYEEDIDVVIEYPQSYTDIYKIASDGSTIPQDESILTGATVSMRLNGPSSIYENLIASKVTVDITKKYILNLIERDKLSENNIFVIRNKRYVCSNIRRMIENGKFNKIIEGDFYRIIDES